MKTAYQAARATTLYLRMIAIEFAAPDFKIKVENGREFIFDVIRKTWLQLNDEEWVRQNFVQYFIKTMRYPASLIALEKEIQLGELKKRFDILVYDEQHKPWMLVECKASSVPLNASVLQQALRYNISVPVPYIIITNGRQTYAWQKQEQSILELDSLPAWK